MSQTILDLLSDSPPVPGLVVRPVAPGDLAELLVLQRCCWVQEAIDNDSLAIRALHETAADLAVWTSEWQTWTLRRGSRLVAAVRARPEGTSWSIGRLMVAPDLAGQGLGRWLLGYAERRAPSGTSRFVLSTGSRSHRNLDLYRRAGYRVVPSEAQPGLSVDLAKDRRSNVTTVSA